jgi:hypothetical protein
MKKIFIALAFLLASGSGWAQIQPTGTAASPALPGTTSPAEDKPLKFNLNESGSHFFQATFLNQTWLRYNQSNPGTTVQGEPADNTFDIGLRRTRIQLFGQITDRTFIYFQFGQNNFNLNAQNAGNRKVAAFFHDAVGEYRLSRGNELKLGAGLTVANGLSRFTNPSVGTLLALDAPVFAQATVDQTDQFNRKLSVYARGQIGKFDYRAVISDPFPYSTSGSTPVLTSNATFAGTGHHKQYQGYLMYQFWDKEAHTTPYMTGTYLGKKKVLNLGGGIISQQKALWSQGAGGDTRFHHMLLWSVEGFLDTPLPGDRGEALTAYLGYYNYDFGPNYVRTLAQMNPADGRSLDPNLSTVSGGGNGVPMIGTGQILYSQLGYLLRQDLLGEGHGALQPYVTYYRGKFDLLQDPSQVYDLGINYLISGHKSKVSLDYQNRPYYRTDQTVAGRRGALILQYQVSI